MVVGSNVGSKWMSDDLMVCVVILDKIMYVIEGVNYMDLYDGEVEIINVMSVLEIFFNCML